MSNNNNKKKNQVSNVERRTWDVEAYEQKALIRQKQQHNNDGDTNNSASILPISAVATTITKEEFIAAPIGAIGPEGSQRAFLQARKRKVKDIDERIGTTTFISIDDAVGTTGNISKTKNDDSTISISSSTGNVTTPDPTIKITDGIVKSSGVGFHCSVCDCYLKDSLTYLDHINGRKHQRKLGYTMRVERSTESDLLSKLEELKKQKQQQNNNTISDGITSIDYNKLVQERDLDEERRKEERQRLRKERRKRLKCEKDNTSIDDDNDIEEVIDDPDDADVELEPQIDPALAAMMGFSGFGGKK
jgi:U4/U6.U5 tri-snRNP component SNU23